MSRAVLSLGANLGDRAATLREVIDALVDDGLVARSTLYETPPWGPVEQPPYLNAIAIVRGSRDAAGWLARAHELERSAGRTREVRFGPRTLDVDVITVTGDDLEKTVNYADLAQRLHAVLTWEPVDLLETLAQRLADVCLADPLVDAVEITVHKPQAELGVPFDDVTVAIRRERR